MNTVGVGTTAAFANLVTPFNPVGKQAVGLENADAKEQPLAPVEQSASTQSPFNRKNNTQQSLQLPDGRRAIDATGQQSGEQQAGEQSTEKADSGNPNRAEQLQQRQDQQLIRELAARDREVRAHEQAHAAVGGQYAGAPSYTYQRGPDGVAYAVSGEVPISIPVAGDDPRATLAAAEQVRRAALAPAEPSAQDRQVAAQAARIALQARADIASQQTQDVAEDPSSVDEAEDDVPAVDQSSEPERAQNQDDRQQQSAENRRRTQEFGDQLIALERIDTQAVVGAFIDSKA